MKEYIINKLSELGKISERTIEKHAIIKKNMMKFNITSYKVDNVGYLSHITMKAMFGLMKMETLVFTPLKNQMPLLSYDSIDVGKNKNILILELYNIDKEEPELLEMSIVKDKYNYLSNKDLGEHWYDSLKLSPSLAKQGKKVKDDYIKLSKEWIDAYFEVFKNSKEAIESEKKELVKAYVDGLFENGGPSTDQFINMIGKEDAYELFSKYVFSSTAESLE